MQIDGWKYYNHAAVPTTPAHIDPNMLPLHDKSIWKIEGKSPLLVRWTTDFDCNCETNWWYVIRYAPFDTQALDNKIRKHVRQALKRVSVRLIDMECYSKELSAVQNAACKGYANYTGNFSTPEDFVALKSSSLDCWGAFSQETNQLVGFMTCLRQEGCVESLAAKYDPAHLSLRASDAIHFTVLEHYLNNENYKYLSSGARTINHATNVQDYKISTFGFKKAFCKLHIVYSPKVKWFIKLIYPFRKLLMKLNNITVVRSLNSILQMEEICRTGGQK